MVELVGRHGDRVGAFCTVNGHGLSLVGPDEVEIMVCLGVLATGNLGGHEVGQYLLGPFLLRVFQVHHTTKPEVGCLMSHEFCAAQYLFFSRGVTEEDVLVVQQDEPQIVSAS